MKATSLILPGIAVVALIYAVTTIAQSQPKRELLEPSSLPPTAIYQHSVAAAGLVEPSTENISIGSHLSGVVETVFVKPGDHVRRGQALFALDRRALEASHEMAEAKIAQAVAAEATVLAQLEQARRRHQTALSLSGSRAMAAEESADRGSEVLRLEALLAEARAAGTAARAGLKAVATDIDRSTVTAPLDASVLQVRVRAGEFIEGGSAAEPRLVLGGLEPLHIRADVDEYEIGRVQAGSPATATPRGDASRRHSLAFVRFEPMVVPKRSLTGQPTERTDTRVLQVIYRVLSPSPSLFVGQQVDVFIEAPPRTDHPSVVATPATPSTPN